MEKERHIRWDFHQNHLQTMFSHQLDQGRFCDVTLACDRGQSLRVHRSVLCACSIYFDTILTDATSGKETIIILKDCKFEEIHMIIEFMYKGEISVREDYLPTLKKTAEFLQIQSLVVALGSFEKTNFNESHSNVITTMRESNLPATITNRLQNVETRSQSFIVESFSTSTSNKSLINEPQILLPVPDMNNKQDTDTELWQPIIPKKENPEDSLTDEQEYYVDLDDDDQDSIDYQSDTIQFNDEGIIDTTSISLTVEQQNSLNIVEPGSNYDCTFIRNALLVLFDKERLKKMNLQKKSKRNSSGILISEKNIIMNASERILVMKLFTWRLRRLNLSQEEYDKRNSHLRVSKLISKCLYYLKKRWRDDLSLISVN